jgi:hypothetical protein
MSVATSSIPAALDYLVAAATAAFPDALVLDGPPKSTDQQEFQDVVSIGWDGDDQMLTAAAEGDQDFAAINRALTRDETYRIVCSALHWDGGDSYKAARDGAFTLLAGFERLVRGYPPNGTGDTSLGGAVQWSHISGGVSLNYTTSTNGVGAYIIFHVTCRARLTGV